jgi:hypothetical protein
MSYLQEPFWNRTLEYQYTFLILNGAYIAHNVIELKIELTMSISGKTSHIQRKLPSIPRNVYMPFFQDSQLHQKNSKNARRNYSFLHDFPTDSIST